MSLLAHLVPRLGAVEPPATQALAYLLHSDEAARAFVHLLIPTGVSLSCPLRVTAEEHHKAGCPDLTVRDQEDRIRILVENKFWSGLTEHQPVAYLKQLPENVAAALLFVVPEQRLPALWDELCRLCEQAGVHLEEESSQGSLRWRRQKCREQDVHRRTLAITSWKHVLETLDHADESETYRCDVSQLRSLTDKMDQDAFLPLGPEEVTDQSLPRRLVNYSDLIGNIVEFLVTERVASTRRLNPAHGWHRTGRYLRLYGRFGLWLGFHRLAWKRWGLTPIWTRHSDDSDWSGLRIREAKNLFSQAKVHGDFLYLPIRLTTGVDRDRVVQDAVEQLRCIGRELADNFPPTDSSAEASE